MIDTELSSIFKSCADAIRSKTGDLSATYTPYELSEGINSIPSGGEGKWKSLFQQLVYGWQRTEDIYLYDDEIYAIKDSAFRNLRYGYLRDGGYSTLSKRLSVDFPNVKQIGEGSAGDVFYGSNLAYANLPSLTALHGANNFSTSGYLSSLDLPKLEKLDGNPLHQFSHNTHLTSINLPKLSSITTNPVYLFYQDTSLREVNMPLISNSTLNTFRADWIKTQQVPSDCVFHLADGDYNGNGERI